MTNTDSYRIAEMTWEDAEKAMAAADYIALPCGSTEQHSLHLPLGVDSMRAHELLEEVVTRAPSYDLRILTLPTLPYGYAEHHSNFAGTVSISPETYSRFIVDIGTSLAHNGMNRFLVFNTHLGNEPPLKLAVDRLLRDHDIPTHHIIWTDYAEDLLNREFGEHWDWDHASAHETSVLEHYHPELVKEERKQPPNRKSGLETRSTAYFDDLTEQGGTADPTVSDPEAIEGVIDTATERILEALKNDKANDEIEDP